MNIKNASHEKELTCRNCNRYYSSHTSKSKPEKNSENYLIPYKAFNKNYHKVLFSLYTQYYITKSERRLLFEMSRFAYIDGQCYPKQTTLSQRLDLSVRQIRRITASLRDKGFIEIKKLKKIKHYLWGKKNEYFFICHDLYKPFLKKKTAGVSGEMSAKNTTYTTYNNKYNKRTPSDPSGAFFTKDKKITKLEHQIKNHCHGLHRFNIYAFTKKYYKAYPAEAVKQTLMAVLQKMKSCKTSAEFKLTEWWGYAVHILKRIGGNMNEQQSIKEAQACKFIKPPEQLLSLISTDKRSLNDRLSSAANTNSDIMARIEDQCRNLNRFSIRAFVREYQKIYPTEAIRQTLDALWQKMQECVDNTVFKHMEWWKYAVQSLKQISGNINQRKDISGTSKNMEFFKKTSVPEHKIPGQCVKTIPHKHRKSFSYKPYRRSPKLDIKQSELSEIKDTHALDKFIRKQNLSKFEKTRIRQGKMYALQQKYFKSYCNN